MPKGQKFGGRKKGTPNKSTTSLKTAVLEAAERAGGNYGSEGVVSYLEHQAMENPTAFMTMLGKAIPTQVDNTSSDGSMSPVATIKITTPDK